MKHMLIVLLLMAGTFSFAQSAEQIKTVGNEPLLQENAVLKELAQKVNDAQAEVQQSNSGSRAQGQLAHQHLKEACNAYLAELKNQRNLQANNAGYMQALDREIAAVEKLTPVELIQTH